MKGDAENLLREAERSAERSIAFVRCVIGLSIFMFFFVVVKPTLEADNPALILIPYFAVVSVGYVAVGIAAIFAAGPDHFRGWMTWVFTTFDLFFWCGLLFATVWAIDLPGNYIIALPPALIAFVILAVVALRNNPWLQAYALVFVVLTFVVLYSTAKEPVSVLIEGANVQIEFFAAPLNIVRLLMVALTGLILMFLAFRTRGMLKRAISETVRRTMLSRYLPAQLAGRLSQGDSDNFLTGTSTDAAVLFVDIRGFTALSEAMEPASLSAFLSEFRQIVTIQVHRNNGLVDKFVGDSVMAVFGAPESRGTDAEDALNCSTDILAAIQNWNVERRSENKEGVEVGLGVHFGEVFCGTVGDSTRLEFTVLGDTVNVAARLEQLTKDIGKPIAVSQEVLVAAGIAPSAKTGWVIFGETSIRGRQRRVSVFTRS